MHIENTPGFGLKNAYAMARHSANAYNSDNEIHNKLCNWGYTTSDFFSSNQIQCYAAARHDHNVISYRGTEFKNIQDWIINLDFRLHDFIYGNVHAGFDAGANKVLNNVKKFLRLNPKKPTFINGHSQGAALGGISAARLGSDGFELIGIYRFGSPRIGDQSFAEKYNNKLGNVDYRIVNNNDIVTRVPPRSMNYVHTGTLKYFKETGELTSDLSDWDQFLDRLHGRAADVLEWGTDGLKDHDIWEYVRLCGQASEVVEV